MRIMRVFRSLRVVNKIKELKLVCQCVVFSLKRTFNIIIVIVLCLFMFAVIGVNLFQGKFRYCTDLTKMTEEECQGNYFYSDNPIGDPNLVKVARRVWKNSNFHFDNVLFAFLTLFSCGTGEGWPIIMEKSIDATTVDHGPILNNNMFMSLYYVTFVVVYSFFFLNIFVALIIVTFQEQGEKEMTGSELDKNQRACLQFVLNAKPRQRFMPKDVSGFSFKVWRVVDSKPFEIIIMVLIALNAIGLMLSFDEQSEGYGIMLDNINLAFTFIFTLEAMLKLMAYKFNYFRDSWNVLDFVIVFITLVGAIIKITSQDFPIALSFFRLFRAFRLLKLLRQGYNIRILLWTFLQSLKGLPYVVLLIIMMFFIYAVIGMQLFSKIAFNDKKKINEYNHFQTFISSLGVLFRCGTGEAWHLVMLDCFDDAPCYNDVTMTCGSTVTSVIYFVTFYFLYAFLLLNLFVAVIMDNFDYLTRDESILGPHHMDEFVRVWSEYDPSAAGRIPHGEIYQLMCDMQPPVGFGKKCPKYLAYKRLMKLNMPISGDNTVLFTPTLFALVRTSLNMTSNENECFRDSSFRKIIKRIWPNTTQKTLDLLMPEHTVLSGQQITIGKIYAAKRIYESFQEIRRRRNCILPQFEEFEASNHHKRGNSLLRKIKGVLRTSSHPLSSEKVQTTRPRDDFMLKRKRSNTSGSHPELYGKNEASRVRSASHLATKLNDPMGKSRQRRSSKQMMFQSAPSINIVDASPTEEIATVVRNHSPVTEQNSEGEQALTNSLITALRDPAKPILCFVNPQLHRVEHRVEGSNRIPGDTEDNRDHNNGDRRPSNSRGRQRHVMVSLPMIKLEIPVDRDSDFVDLATDGGNNNRNNIRRRSNSNLEHSDNMMPDLLKSLRNTSVPAVEPSTDQLSSDESGSSPSSIRSDRSQHSEDHGGGSDNERRDSDESCNRDILRELNDQLNIAISEGVQPTWLYKITEDEGDTWC